MRANGLIKRGVRSGSTLVAHSDSMCGFVSTIEEASSAVESQLLLVSKIDRLVGIVGRLQLLYGLRISEILDIRGCDIDRLGRIVVLGKKGSSPRLVVDNQDVDWWIAQKGLGTNEVFGFNRFYVYRIYNQCGIVHSMAGKKHKVVTHYCRHLYVKSMQQSTNDIEITKHLTGHKAVGNTKKYLQSKIK